MKSYQIQNRGIRSWERNAGRLKRMNQGNARGITSKGAGNCSLRVAYAKKRRRILKRRLKRAGIAVAVLAAITVAVMMVYKGISEAGEEEKGGIPEVMKIQPEDIKKETKARILPTRNFDEEDRCLLAKIAMAEAEGESTEGKAMVIMVVLNRVGSGDFPDNITDVIFDDGQFSPVKEGGRFYTTEPDEDCWKAMDLIMQGWDESEGALYFEATYNGENTWHSRNLEYIKTVGNHNFYK
jgi:N-acetylmuramoyl-L-alanine amidase